jgi:beta-galactosidase
MTTPQAIALAMSASALALPVAAAEGFVHGETRRVLDLGGMWEARSTTVDLSWPPPADGWKPQAVPHPYSDLITHDDIGPYWPTVDRVVKSDGSPVDPARAAAWFRRALTLDASVPAGMRARLRCDGIAWRSVVYLNGARVGGSVLGLAPQSYDVTDALRKGANELVIGATGRAGLWDQARKTFVAPIAGVMAGVYEPVVLELVPETRIDDVFVRTSVARRRLDVDLELVNDGPRPRTLTPRVWIADPLGQPCLTLAGESVTLAAHGRATVSFGADWLAAHLWSPGTPDLHRAHVAIDEKGAVRDAVEQPFGFREFSARGRDFTLNGRRQVLLRTSWLRAAGYPRADMLGFVRDETAQFNCVRLHLGFNNPHILDQADRSGMMVVPEFWGWYRNNNKPFPIAQADAWASNAAETIRLVIRRHRNHPSVIMWSLTNETFWDSTAADQMAVAERLVRTARAADPTRPLQGDAEITWSNRLDAINIHYPEGDAGTVGKRHPNSGWIVPNDLDWLRRDGANHAWRADFVWDRPLVIGEFYARDGDAPERYTPYAGDAAYDRTKWAWQAFDGRDAMMPPGSPWIDMVKMSCDHYRAAGVAGLNPWTGIGAQLMPPLLVAPLDHHPNLFGGETAARTFFVANDHHAKWNGMHLQAGLLVDGREVWSERNVACQADPGESRRVAVTLRPPAVTAPTRARLIVRLCWMRGPVPTELCRHEEDAWIMPRASLAGESAAGVALADVEGGATARALAALGLRAEPGPSDDAALAGKRVLVIGESAAASADLPAAARFAAAGGRVLVLHQTELAAFLPWQPEIDPRHAASFSWRQSPHPALAGLDDGQLRFWRPDHLVATETYVRPAEGAAQSVAACGGRYGMHWSPLVRVPHGKGSVLFCQYRLADRVDVEPAARWLLARAIQAALAAEPAEPAEPAPPLALAPGVGHDVRAMLATCRVATTEGLGGGGPLLLDAARPPDATALERLRGEIAAGRNVWLRGLAASNATGVAALLPWKPGFLPLDKAANGAVRRGDHPLLAGIGSGDLHWPSTPLGGPVVVPPSLDAAVQLTEPALLAAVPVGRGWVLIDQLGWEQTLASETERGTRLASALARNLGAGFLAPRDETARFRFTGLDLSAHANRGYVDEVAGDGLGGWTDQGDNDMRFFLINHTGLVGGMAVAEAPFPTTVSLQGVSYRLLDPKANGGRAVIALRGGEHDPASPSGARGIAAGGARAERVWFLHAGTWVTDVPHGATIARYEIVYADGTRAEAPVRSGIEVSDWWNPKPLSGARVAWTGRNAKTAPIGIYAMAWPNPHPEKPIASLDVVGNLTGAQLVLLAVTLGVEAAGDGERTVAAWDCGRFEEGRIPALVGGEELAGTGTPAALDARAGVRLAASQSVSGRLPDGPLAAGRPLAIEIEVAPEGPPAGYCGGLFEAGSYQQCGLRIVLGRDLRVSVEQWGGAGPERAVYLKSREPLPVGRFSAVRYEHDGACARLLVDGQLHDVKPSPPPAPWRGDVRIGQAGGKDYFYNGIVAGVRVLALKASATDAEKRTPAP